MAKSPRLRQSEGGGKDSSIVQIPFERVENKLEAIQKELKQFATPRPRKPNTPVLDTSSKKIEHFFPTR